MSITEKEVSSPIRLSKQCDCGGKLKVWTEIHLDILMYFAICEECGQEYRADGWWGIWRWHKHPHKKPEIP